MNDGVEHLVGGHPGLDDESPTVAASSDQAGGAREQGQRLLARSVPRGEKLLVEVEEGDHVGAGDPVEYCLGTDEHTRVIDRTGCVSTHLHNGAAGEPLEVVPHLAHPGT